MEFEVLHRSKKKQFLIIGALVVLILIAIVIGFTFAKYRVTKSFTLAQGTVNYSKADLNLIGVYLEDKNTAGQYNIADEVPASGYLLNEEKSSCTVDGEKDTSISISYASGKLNFNGLTKRGTKCSAYFDVIRDTEKPVITKVDSSVTENSITVTVTATDNETVTEYSYKIGNNEEVVKSSNTHTFSGLVKNTSYQVVIYAIDASGNRSTAWEESIKTKGETAKDVILADNTTSSSRSGAITGTFSGTSHTLYTKQDDWGTSYFYAGNINNNWVHFAGYYWRIIRINGDGSIRMIYNGTSTSGTGTGTQLQTSVYNSNYNDNAYVGYMYGSTGASSYSGAHANTNNSTIKGILDNWYKTNIVDKKDSSGTSYNKYVSTEAGFCNDRKVVSGWSGYGTLGYGTNNTVYAPFSRILTTSGSWNSTQTPTLNCSQSNDLFTTSGSSKGNKKLTYPVGLITSDEVVLAGGFGGTRNSSYYLYTGQTYWTMSPYYFDRTYALVFYVYSTGALGNWSVNNSCGVRPVINLKADVELTGDGTVDSPYEVIG